MSGSAGGFSHAVVGVGSLEEAARLWVDTFGLSVMLRREGADDDLENLWGLAPRSYRTTGADRHAGCGDGPAPLRGVHRSRTGGARGRPVLRSLSQEPRRTAPRHEGPLPGADGGRMGDGVEAGSDAGGRHGDIRGTAQGARRHQPVAGGSGRGRSPLYPPGLHGGDPRWWAPRPTTPRSGLSSRRCSGLEHLDYHLFEGPEVERMVGPSGRRQARHAYPGRPGRRAGPDRAGAVRGRGGDRPLSDGQAARPGFSGRGGSIQTTSTPWRPGRRPANTPSRCGERRTPSRGRAAGRW